MNSVYDVAIEQVQNAIYIEPWVKEIIEESLKKQIPQKQIYTGLIIGHAHPAER